MNQSTIFQVAFPLDYDSRYSLLLLLLRFQIFKFWVDYLVQAIFDPRVAADG